MDHLNFDYEIDLGIEIPYRCHKVYKTPEAGSSSLDDRWHSWLRYPNTQGLDEQYLVAFDWQQHSKEEVESLVQTWLFYGVLFEVFSILEIPIDIADFIAINAAGDKIVSTRPLHNLLVEWKEKPYDPSAVFQIREILQVMCRHNATYCASRDKRKPALVAAGIFTDWPCSEATALSISSLGRTLHAAWADVYAAAGTSIMGMGWGLSDLLNGRLRRQGWCPCDIKMLESSVSVNTQYYLCSISNPRGDHSACSDPTVEKPLGSCKYADMDSDSYVLRHTSDCPRQGCELIGPDVKEVTRIIEEGGVPLVTWRKAANSDAYELAVTKHDSYSLGEFRKSQVDRCLTVPEDYVVISHVWSEGRGNPNSNTLPKCQILAIQESVNRLYDHHDSDPETYWNTKAERAMGDGRQQLTVGHVQDMLYTGNLDLSSGPARISHTESQNRHNESRKFVIDFQVKQHGSPPAIPWFWMDTLCVPVGDELVKTRRKAIEIMALIYKMAHRCLVLDDTLSKVSCRAPLRSLGTHLFNSTWIRRLWTLQEGIIPDRVHLQCQDGDRVIDTLIDELKSLRRSKFFRPYLEYDLMGPMLVASNSYSASANPAERYDAITRCLIFRSTSHARDELICLAHLLGISPTPYTDMTVSWEDRTALLLRAIGHLNSRIIFSNTPRLQKEGMSWAPHSLLHSSTESLMGQLTVSQQYDPRRLELAEIGSRGELRVRQDGLSFNGSPFSCASRSISILQPDGGDVWYSVYFPDNRPWSSMKNKFPQDGHFSVILSEPLSRFVPRSSAYLSMIMGAPFSYLAQMIDTPWKLPEDEGRVYLGLLVYTMSRDKFHGLPELGDIPDPMDHLKSYPDMSRTRQRQVFQGSSFAQPWISISLPSSYVERDSGVSDEDAIGEGIDVEAVVGGPSTPDETRQQQTHETTEDKGKAPDTEANESSAEERVDYVKTCCVVWVRAIGRDDQEVLRDTFYKPFLDTGENDCSEETCKHGHPMTGTTVRNCQWYIT